MAQTFGEVPAELPIAFPISLRSSDDPLGGNRFAGARFAAPLAERDPAERMRLVRELVREARQEPAIDVAARLAPLLLALPASVVARLILRQTETQDLQASNVPGVAHPVYLAGARITHAYAFGPLPGCAATITMTSHDGTGCLGVNLDPAAVTDPARLVACLQEGFAEILGSGPQRMDG